MTSTPFVASLRSRPEVVRLSDEGASTITIRVQLAEAWDAVRIQVSTGEPVATVKGRAIEVLDPSGGFPDEYAVTLGGKKILDERASLATAGVVNGSTLLIEHRHRRPVR